MNITVYLGASNGNDSAFQQAIRELGKWIAENGHTVVYGGSKAGLMGDLAESALLAGGKVIGVEPQFFIDAGYEYNAVTELIVTEDMSQRKAKMISLGDAFIAFPGGSGTLEEISEVISKVCLHQLNAPVLIYNLDGYYDSLKALFAHMVDKGLLNENEISKIHFVSNLKEIVKFLK